MENKNIEIIKDKEDIIAIIIYKDYQKEGVKFFTPADFSQQLAFISHKKGKIIGAHSHNIVRREVRFTQEVLVIKKGILKVNFYDSGNNYFLSKILRTGDIILLSGGGHGFEVLEDLEMIEVKQGPYLEDGDKTRFKGVEEQKL